MDIMGVAESKMNEMSALSQKYIDYRPVNPSEVRYRDVQNDFEKEMASKVANGVTWLIAIVGIAFTASGILGVSTGKTALGKVLRGILNFISRKEAASIVPLIDNCQHPASFSIDLAFPEDYTLYRVSAHFKNRKNINQIHFNCIKPIE